MILEQDDLTSLRQQTEDMRHQEKVFVDPKVLLALLDLVERSGQ